VGPRLAEEECAADSKTRPKIHGARLVGLTAIRPLSVAVFAIGALPIGRVAIQMRVIASSVPGEIAIKSVERGSLRSCGPSLARDDVRVTGVRCAQARSRRCRRTRSRRRRRGVRRARRSAYGTAPAIMGSRAGAGSRASRVGADTRQTCEGVGEGEGAPRRRVLAGRREVGKHLNAETGAPGSLGGGRVGGRRPGQSATPCAQAPPVNLYQTNSVRYSCRNSETGRGGRPVICWKVSVV
jgi:hypothetical protein